MSGHVAIFLPSLAEGGAERAMLNLASGMADRGLGVDLVLACAHGPYLSEVPSSVRVVDLGANRVLTSTPRLARYLRAQRPSVVLAAMDHANLIALWARGLAQTRTPVIVTTHSLISLAARGQVPWRERFIPILVRIFYPKADAIVAVSRAAADELARVARLPSGTIHVIYNPVVTSSMHRAASQESAPPGSRGGPVAMVLAVGRLAREKDHATLIRAFQLVVRDRPARLAILGEGPERPRLEALAASLHLQHLVAMPGHVEDPYGWMERAAVFVQSSRWEGMGLALTEAMAAGTPVVSTDCPGGVREILLDGRLGRLVPVGDVSAMAAAILDVLANPPPTEPLRRRALDFSLDASVERYLALMSPFIVGQGTTPV